jgi:maltose alpha-D-glucosyltransferase/alpha-amylase
MELSPVAWMSAVISPEEGRRRSRAPGLPLHPTWYQDAIIYEIPIRAFADSDGDGIGDIEGLISKLDYIEDLGVTAIWLLPFYPSPLRDGGYDIADYTSVHPMYGGLADFKRLLRAAHDRGIRVITELVLNHTSKDHPWFARARKAPTGSKWRDFYVWSDTPDRYRDARIIFKDFETSNWSWDAEANAYFWHRFYSHQPDLNFDNPEVHKAVFKAVDFWLEMGVDGLRLDAVPYLYEREGTNCENLPETHAFLKKLRAHVDARFPGRMLLAEANQWPEDAAAYFGNGDECHMNFHFPLMPRMFMSVQLEDRFPVVDILHQTPPIPPNSQWATFLRNHDELTLEMVTDEERDYMYRVYADDPTARINLGIRRRLAPLLKSRNKVELMNGLLLSLPGTPVLYYGDEIGMGDNIYLGDRDGVRTPMQWSADLNAGFSSANPQKLHLPVVIDPEYRCEAVNVQAQQSNPASILWWMKRLIGLRKQHRALSAGSFELIFPDNPKVLAFVRELERERVLVLANLSRFHQWIELDLRRFAGMVPVEMSGIVRFPPVTEAPYMLSLAPHGFMWLLLESAEATDVREEVLPTLEATTSWRTLLDEAHRRPLERAILRFVTERRWFRGKARRRKSGAIADAIPIKGTGGGQALVIFRIEFAEGNPETYAVPLAFHAHAEATVLHERHPHAAIAHVNVPGEPLATGTIFDGVASGSSLAPLLRLMHDRAISRGEPGALLPWVHRSFKEVAGTEPLPLRMSELEQTNSTVVFGEKLVFKLLRQVDEGVNSEVEIGAFLTEKAHFPGASRVLGALNYHVRGRENTTVGIVQEFIRSEGPAWDMTLGRLQTYFEAVLTRPTVIVPRLEGRTRVARAHAQPSLLMHELIGPYLSEMRLLGRRTAELHLALANHRGDPSFAPEPFGAMHQQSIFQWSHALLRRNFESLRPRLRGLPVDVRHTATELLDREREIDRRLREVTKRKIDSVRIRCHGDLHLGQVLYTGQDFRFIDFEGEPARPLNERRYKRSPLRDAVGLIRSFDYAAASVLRSGRLRPEDVAVLGPWAAAWSEHVASAYLGAYLETAAHAHLYPKREEDTEMLLVFYELEKVIYEIGYELNNRPEWIGIPLDGLKMILDRNTEGG